MRLQGLAALVDGDQFLELDLALLQALHDALELGEGLLEGEPGEVGLRLGRGHRCSFHEGSYGGSGRK